MRRPEHTSIASARFRAFGIPLTFAAVLVSAAAVVATHELRMSEPTSAPHPGPSLVATPSVIDWTPVDTDGQLEFEQQGDPHTERFNNRPIRPVKTITMRVTAYSPDEQSCGEWADGITASGFSVLTNAGNLVAADTSILPFGSLVSVPGYDENHVVPVLDRGGAIKGNRLDVLFPTHEEAMEWGVRDLEVTIWEYDDGQPNGFREQHRRW